MLTLILLTANYIRVFLLPDAANIGLENGFESIEELYLNSDYIFIGSFNENHDVLEVNLNSSLHSKKSYKLQEFVIGKVLKGDIDSTIVRIPEMFFSELNTFSTLSNHTKIQALNERYPGECILFVDKIESYGEDAYKVQNSFQSLIEVDDKRLILENREQAIFMWIFSKNHLIKKIDTLNRKYNN